MILFHQVAEKKYVDIVRGTRANREVDLNLIEIRWMTLGFYTSSGRIPLIVEQDILDVLKGLFIAQGTPLTQLTKQQQKIFLNIYFCL